MSATAVRLKRLRLRSWRRGTREMDLILGPFADACLDALDDHVLEDFEEMLSQDDHVVYQWLTGRCKVPERFEDIAGRIRQYHRFG